MGDDLAEAQEFIAKGVAAERAWRGYEEILAAYENAARIAPQWAEPWNRMSTHFRRYSAYDRSLDAAESAIKLEPANYLGWYNKGLALKALERPQESIAALAKCMELAPKFLDGWVNKGTVHVQQKQWREGLDCARAALKLDAKYHSALTLEKACTAAGPEPPAAGAPPKAKAH